MTPQTLVPGMTDAIKAEALAGRGVAVLPRTAIAEEITSGALLSCSVSGFEPYRTVYLTSLSRKALSPVARSFLRLIKGQGTPEEAVAS